MAWGKLGEGFEDLTSATWRFWAPKPIPVPFGLRTGTRAEAQRQLGARSIQWCRVLKFWSLKAVREVGTNFRRVLQEGRMKAPLDGHSVL